MVKKIRLRNGLRVISIPQKEARTVTLLLIVGVGSRYEKKNLAGISHFLEHMFFKGTNKRPNTQAISEYLDEIGGEYNAFTSKEYTGFYVKTAPKHIRRAFDFISDILMNSRFETKDIIKEKPVVIEEMNMIKDVPMHYVSELFERLLYGQQPLGRMIIGTEKTVLNLDRNKLINHLKNYYISSNIVISVGGKIDHKNCFNLTKKYFSKIPKGEKLLRKKVKDQQNKPEILIQDKQTDQTHFCLGVRSFDIFHPDRYVQEVLATILGGSMSSRLFLSIREKHGLAYYIKADTQYYTDAGYLVVQAGVDNKKVDQAIKLCLDEFRRIVKQKVSQKELCKAKEYIKGKTLINLETSDELAMFYNLEETLTSKIETPKEKFKKIDKVSDSDIQRVAKKIFTNARLNLALIGPHKDKRVFKRILKMN